MAKSKVAKIKEEMMWQKFGPMCSNCNRFTVDVEHIPSQFGGYDKEKNKRCSLGSFATSKSYWCPEHKFKITLK